MAMRPQTVEASLTYNTPSRLGANDHPLATANGSVSIFDVSFGRVVEAKSTDFIVIEHIGSSPTSPTTLDPPADYTVFRGFVQIRINTTEYFLYPDGSHTPGIPSFAAPYPISVDFQPAFILYPDIYVLPGQNWDIVYTLGDMPLVDPDGQEDGAVGPIHVFVKYTLYDGIDAVIANKLLELGISVKPANVDWYKRKVMTERQ